MKRLMMAAVLAAALLAAGCEQFTTSYQRVDESEFRVLDFTYLPLPDISPGDNFTLRAVFAGKNVNLDDYLEWWISFNVIRDHFGSETVTDSMRLEPIATRRYDMDFSLNTQTVAFNIAVPKNIVRESRAIPEIWTDMLPPYMVKELPAALASLTKNQMVDAIEAFIDNDAEGSAAITENIQLLPMILQFFTVPIRISAKVKEPGRLPHTIRSSHTIRYNRAVVKNAAEANVTIPINTNPRINSIAIFKVKGDNVTTLDDNLTGVDYDMILLHSWNWAYNAIPVEKGYTYFLEAITTDRDSTISMGGLPIRERHWVYCHFQLDKDEAANVHHTKYPNINNSSGLFTMPASRDITKFTFWITVQDEVINERMRPAGSTLAEVSGWFVYK